MTDWRGEPLQGDGGEASALYQVIYAGPDGVPQPPAVTNGAPTGDDLLLSVFLSGEAFGRFGAGVAAGYRGDPERTAERFVEHDGERWYRTGDVLRYLPGGFLDFLGRADHMVKVRGYRVELGEVEAALLRAPGVTGAVAWSDERDLRAAVALADRSETPLADSAGVPRAESVGAVTGDDLRDGLAAELPPHMIPRTVAVLDELPLTGNGKYDRAAVAALTEPADRAAGTAPRSPLEEVLVDVLAGVLGMSGVGVHDDFLDLGGDSLQATRFVAELREWLEVTELTVADVFSRRTVAALAEHIAGLGEATGGGLDAAVADYLEISAMSDEEVVAELAELPLGVLDELLQALVVGRLEPRAEILGEHLREHARVRHEAPPEILRLLRIGVRAAELVPHEIEVAIGRAVLRVTHLVLHLLLSRPEEVTEAVGSSRRDVVEVLRALGQPAERQPQPRADVGEPLRPA